MAGRLGIDFGTSNTVIAVWDAVREEGVPMHIADYGRPLQLRTEDDGATEQVSITPSLIHYASGGRRWLGDQVRRQNLVDSGSTFRWMKRYIANRSPVKVKVNGTPISHFEAGSEFLSAVLTMAASELDIKNEEVGFTVPVDSYEHYEDWLSGIATSLGMPRVRLIDEPSAAALGYGTHIQPGQVYLVFDFGGGTLDVVVVLIEESTSAALGRRWRLLGKSGEELGGMTLDQLLFQEVLRRNECHDSDEDIRRISRVLLGECERAKERLSEVDNVDVSVMNPDTGALLSAEFSRGQFEDLLDQHDVLGRIDRTIRRAINASRERGYAEDDIDTVLMVGGSSLIPCVRKTVQRIFGRDRVRTNRPLDAVARGAAAFVAGVDFFDHIQHSYCIRYIDSKKGDYAFRQLVPRGTAYPTVQPVEQMTIKATYQDQTHLGIAIFEMGETRRATDDQPVELVFDPSGAARVVQVTPDEEDRRSEFWINENSPTFLSAEPPAQQGEARFVAEFGIDNNKRLLVTATDLRNNKVMLRDYPVVKLT